MDSPYSKELEVAVQAVHLASRLTKKVMTSIDLPSAEITKSDATPVTIADFSAQAVLIGYIRHHFPNDGFLGEEDASDLRQNPALAEQVWNIVKQNSVDQNGTTLPGMPRSKEEVLDLIDLGRGEGGPTGRFWVMDPVDGTATFLKGQQYAVCLALIEDGQQQVGVLGCPNLKVDGVTRISENTVDREGYGVMLSAIKGQGAFITKMAETSLAAAPQRLEKVGKNLKGLEDLDFVDSDNSSSLLLEQHGAVAKKLGVPNWPCTVIWSQQMKYVALILGKSDVMLRIPRARDRWTRVWDHAGGQLLFNEVRGKITDLEGKEIFFGAGRKIDQNYGMVAAPEQIQATVLKTTQEVLQARQ